MHKILNNIPLNAKISASSALVPHISFRDTIYTFPARINADLILIIKKGSSIFPQTQKQFEGSLNNLKKDTLNYSKIYDNNELLIYKNKKYLDTINLTN
ncbi:MAG: hypothetical protein JHD28_09745 [Bacteroidia bacterium]|nr:hypothetical protein [Bacteroidia bacterium]